MKEQKKYQISRRSFLQISAGMAALAGVSLPKPAYAVTDKQLSTLIDLSLCDGCPDRETPACVSSCKGINKDKIPQIAEPIPKPWPRKTIEDWSEKRNVANRLTPYNFIYVHKANVDFAGKNKTVFVPRRCMHCDNPACATICPFSANHKMENGAVVIDQKLCFGGAKCKTVCPWGIPQRQSGVGIYLHVLPDYMGNGVMYKCDLCYDRLTAGKMPGCVEACPRKAMLIGPKKDIETLAQERARKMNGFIYGKKENGGTATLYVSPVPFELINTTMQKKPGQPDMKPGVKRQMAGTDNMGKTALAAPILGLAVAGAMGAASWFSRKKDQVKREDNDNG